MERIGSADWDRTSNHSIISRKLLPIELLRNILVRLVGLEPTTNGLEIRGSFQLSYRRILAALVGFEPTHNSRCLAVFKTAPFSLLGTAPYYLLDGLNLFALGNPALPQPLLKKTANFVVLVEGVEPSILSAAELKSDVYSNSTTQANLYVFPD